MRIHQKPSAWTRRGDRLLRILAGLPLGYAVGSLWAVALSMTLPTSREAATIIGTIAAFAICAAAMMWAFAARSGWRAMWSLMAIGSLAVVLILWADRA